MSIRSAASQAIVDTFTTVSATTRGVTSGANSFANYSEMLEVHSLTQLTEMKESEQARKAMARNNTRMRLAEHKLDHTRRLTKDPELQAAYDEIAFSDEAPALEAAE